MANRLYCKEERIVLEMDLSAARVGSLSSDTHAAHVIEVSRVLAGSAGLSDDEIAHVLLAVAVHDVARSGIPARLRLKCGPFSSYEQRMMCQHIASGYRIAGNVGNVGDIILYHHEWWDGSGYALGYKGEQIPLLSRILAVTTVYDSLTGPHSFIGMSPSLALEEMKRRSGVQLDPGLVQAFDGVIKSVLSPQMNAG